MKELEKAMRHLKEVGLDRQAIDDLIMVSIGTFRQGADPDWDKYTDLLTELFGPDYGN